MNKKTIAPYLWFDKEAVEAAQFYVSVFPNSKIVSQNVIKDTPSGDCDQVAFELNGQAFYAISAGPYFKINPSISFILNFDASQMDNASETLSRAWERLSESGKILMPLAAYDFSPMYGWVEDKYGVSWQLMLTDPKGDPRPFIVPTLLFCDGVYGQAKEARDFYTSVFTDSRKGTCVEYQNAEPPNVDGNIMFSDFQIKGTWIAAFDSGFNHGFTFNEGISFALHCEDQKELDYFWSKLSHSPENEQCGWCKDQFGVSWQILPHRFDQLMEEGSEKQVQAVTKTFLNMKKLDMNAIQSAYSSVDVKRADIEVVVKISLEEAWKLWNQPDHIQNWYFASDDWHVPHASNDLSVGGELCIGMAAKDGSMSFDFKGTYSKVEDLKSQIYILEDNRKVVVKFDETEEGVRISESFDLEDQMSSDQQKAGWQSILNQFKKYAESIT